jgi:hypothetical protein
VDVSGKNAGSSPYFNRRTAVQRSFRAIVPGDAVAETGPVCAEKGMSANG